MGVEAGPARAIRMCRGEALTWSYNLADLDESEENGCLRMV
jgi:hypothetical protein